MFPYDPQGQPLDARGLFLVQEPELLRRVLPLFRFDPREPEARPVGHGTTFRIDPWNRCATAFHVVEDLLLPSPGPGQSVMLRDDARLAALEIGGLAYGRNPIPEGAWCPIIEASSVFGLEERPLQPPRFRNFTELMVLRIRSPSAGAADPVYLPMDFRRWRPSVGEPVMALGYADLDVDSDGEGDERPMSQYLYGSLCEIESVQPADPGQGRPWPLFRVSANWPGGMSGGPVFSQAGHVVGLVSTSIEAAGVSSATFFSGWDIPQRIFGSVDPDNPGRFRSYCAFSEGQPMFCSQSIEAVQAYAAEHQLTDLGMASVDPVTGDHLRLDS